MARRLAKFVERYDLDMASTETWEPVDVSHLIPTDRETFHRRRKAINLYFEGESIERITQRIGVSKTEFYRVLERALTPDSTGRPYEYLACIPHLRLIPHPGGRFSSFLCANPGIKEMLYGWAMGDIAINKMKVRGRGTIRIWEAFRDLCDQNGINITWDYPFCNQDQGKEVIRLYCKQLRNANFVANARVEFGDSAARLASQAMGPDPDYSDLRPYDLVQFDAHRIDCILNIRFIDEKGDAHNLPLARLWLLVALEVASRAVLGYTLSYGENYSTDDIMACLAATFVPWKHRELTSDDIHYIPGAGFPSGNIKVCTWRAFDTLRMDNHWAHVPQLFQKKIIETGVNEIVLNPAATPRDNAILERFFLTFEEQTGHRLPNTTGSNPRDPRRCRNPDEAAKVLGMDDEDMWMLAELAMANYNASPHSGLNYRTPLEFLQYRLERGEELVRHIPFTSEDTLPLYWREYSRQIKGNPAIGHLPYVYFQGARYSSDELRHRSDLIGKTAKIWVNIVKDIRQIRLFLPNGASLGYLLVEPRWRAMAHTLRTRKCINKLEHNKSRIIDTRSPVCSYVNYLADRAPKDRRSLSRLLKISRDIAENDDLSKFRVEMVPKTCPMERDENWVNIDEIFAGKTNE